jgi:hypothetical protein
MTTLDMSISQKRTGQGRRDLHLNRPTNNDNPGHNRAGEAYVASLLRTMSTTTPMTARTATLHGTNQIRKEKHNNENDFSEIGIPTSIELNQQTR